MLWNAKNGRVPVGDAGMDYVAFGRGGKAFVILPGLSDGLMTVKGKALLLAKPYARFFDRYTVYMFSRRNDLRPGCAIRDMAADQAEAMEKLGLARACVMGVSQGGMIAQCLAIDHPERVDRLVIAVSAPRVNDKIRACVNRWIGLARQGDHGRLMMDTAEMSYSEAYLKKYRMLYPALGKLSRPASYDRFLINAEAVLAFDAGGGLEGIACPTLIIGGAEDRIVGIEASCEMKERIPGSALHVYEGLGHAAYEEAPDFNDRVFRFLEAEG